MSIHVSAIVCSRHYVWSLSPFLTLFLQCKLTEAFLTASPPFLFVNDLHSQHIPLAGLRANTAIESGRICTAVQRTGRGLRGGKEKLDAELRR